MTVLKLNGYDCKEKIYILDNNVIPAIKKQFKLQNVMFTNEIIKYIVNSTQFEQGIRKVKQ